MISIRAATNDDRPLIFATWLRSFRHGASFPRHIPDALYFERHHNVAETLLDRSHVFVATPADDPEVILGWAAWETMEPTDQATPSPVAIHYVYVKPAFRRSGVARRLLAGVANAEQAGASVSYTHETFTLKLPALAEVVGRWVFDPYAALIHAAGKAAT